MHVVRFKSARHAGDGREQDPWAGCVQDVCQRRKQETRGTNVHRYPLGVNGGQVSVLKEGDEIGCNDGQ
jgi:hypothetical protein